MEKTNIEMGKAEAEMAILSLLLRDDSIKAGTPKADHWAAAQKLDEHIDAFIKATVEEGYATSEESDLPDILPCADARTAEFEENIRMRTQCPESLFPMAADVLCRRVHDWFWDELLLHVSDVRPSNNLEIEISGLLTGSCRKDLASRVSGREAYQRKVEQLRHNGWAYRSTFGHLQIGNCHENFAQIEKVVTSLGGQQLKIHTLKTWVESFSFVVSSDRCQNLFQQLAKKPKADKKSKRALVTADDEALIQKNLSDLRFALSGIHAVEDRSVLLSLLRHHMATIEETLGFNDLVCAQIIQARHAEEAQKNSGLQVRQDQMGRAALETLNLREAYDNIETALQKFFAPLGMRAEGLHMGRYAATRFSTRPSFLCCPCEKRKDLEFVPDAEDGAAYLVNTPENIQNVQNVLQETMPGARIEKIESSLREGKQIVKKLHVMINPSDIAKILQATKNLKDPTDE